MNNNKYKESLRPWAQRLFRQTGASKTKSASKTYFAHRYYDQHTGVEPNPFSAFFSEASEDHLDTTPDQSEFKRIFDQASLSCHHGDVKPAQAPGTNFQKTPGLALDLPYGAALSAPFIVLNCYDETPDTKTFRLGSLNGQLFDYLPGQYITLSVVISGQEYKRSYSLASTPSRQGILEITVKRVPDGGVVSNWLIDHLKIGDTLNLKGPFGKFSCAKDTPEKILFLAAGSGIVPIMSMLRWIAETEARADVLLLLSFRTPEDIIYRDELKLIAARHPNIKLAVTLTTDSIARYQWNGLTGRVNGQMIAEQAPDLLERTVYLCGPDDFMADCKKHLLNLELPPGNLFCESFTVNTPVIKPEDSSQGRLSRGKTGSYRVSFVKSGKSIVADGRMTLLELVEESGIPIDHECRAGNCGECMIKCLKGKVEMLDLAEIDDLDRKKGWIYACCAYPASNVELDV